MHCLDWACDYWATEGIFATFAPPVWSEGGDEKHVGRYRHPRLPLASVAVYRRERTGPRGGGDIARVSLHCRINLSPFTKDFRGGELSRVICIFGGSAHSRATSEGQEQSDFACLPPRGVRMRSWSLSVFAAFADSTSRLRVYPARMQKLRLLVREGIQTLDMLSFDDRFSSSSPVSDHCASSILSDRASRHPPHALVV